MRCSSVRSAAERPERLYAETGDCMDFGDGVQQLLVSDVTQRDFLR